MRCPPPHCGGDRMSARALAPEGVDGNWFAGDLQPHQRPALDFLLGHPHAVLADDVGLGKTPTALAYIGKLEEAQQLVRRTPTTRARVLWVTDVSLLAQTKAEVERFLPDFSVITTECPEMRDTIKARREWSERFGEAGPDILVIGYSFAASRLPWLQKTVQPNLVVLDEASRINGGGKQFNAIRELTKSADRVVSMTATPVENDGMELWHLLAATQVPGLWAKGTFEREFVTWQVREITPYRTERRPDGWVASRLPEVRGFLRGCMLQRTAEGVGLPLPRREGDLYRWVPLTAADLRAYESTSQRQGQAAVQAMEAIGRSSRWLGDALISELNSMNGRQAVVYCESLPVLDRIEDRLRSEGITYRRVEGKVAKADRDEAVGAFAAGECQVFLGSRVLERGIDGLQACRDLISLDPSWNPARERQREGRVRRIGSRHETYRHLSIVPDTDISRAKLKRLDKKRAIADAINLSIWGSG